MPRLRTKRLSSKNLKLIRETIKFWGKIQRMPIPEYKRGFSQAERDAYWAAAGYRFDCIKNGMVKLGWKVFNEGQGSYKIVFAHGRIVCKIPGRANFRTDPMDESFIEIRREWEQWKNCSSTFRKYLPENYAFIEGLLVQEKLEWPNYQGARQNLFDEVRDKVSEIAREYALSDWGHNYTIQLNPIRPVFFDWVWKRHGQWLNARESLPKDRKSGK